MSVHVIGHGLPYCGCGCLAIPLRLIGKVPCPTYFNYGTHLTIDYMMKKLLLIACVFALSFSGCGDDDKDEFDFDDNTENSKNEEFPLGDYHCQIEQNGSFVGGYTDDYITFHNGTSSANLLPAKKIIGYINLYERLDKGRSQMIVGGKIIGNYDGKYIKVKNISDAPQGSHFELTCELIRKDNDGHELKYISGTKDLNEQYFKGSLDLLYTRTYKRRTGIGY